VLPSEKHWAAAVPDATQAVANKKEPNLRPGRDFDPVIVNLPFVTFPKKPALIDPSVSQVTLGDIRSRYFSGSLGRPAQPNVPKSLKNEVNATEPAAFVSLTIIFRCN
jgi:hypothetical protein